MAHLDDEQLSLLALGEDLGKEADVHARQCPACAETLHALQQTVLVATADSSSVQLQNPGSHNWAAIHATLGLSPSLAADPLSTIVGGDHVKSDRGTFDAGQSDRGTSAPAGPTPLRPHKKQPGDRRGLWILGVAAGTAAGLVIGAWTATTVSGPAESPRAVPGTSSPAQTGPAAGVLAAASLQPLASHSASGEAFVEQLSDGSRH